MDGMTDSFAALLGGHNSLFEMMGMTAKDLGGYIAYGCMFLIAFIIGYNLWQGYHLFYFFVSVVCFFKLFKKHFILLLVLLIKKKK